MTITVVAQLSSLSLTSAPLDQVFQSSLNTYTATVGYLANLIKITATTADAGATVSVNGTNVDINNESQLLPLNEGLNTAINIVVTAADSTTNTYTLTVTRQTAASFAQLAYTKASNAEANDEFSANIALSGDTLAVGTPYEDGDATSTAASPNNGAANAGAVYIFTRSGSSWSQQAYLKASNAGAGDEFGRAVALSGDTLVVGAAFEDGDVTSTAASPNDNAASAGAIYVFTRSGSSWSQQAYLKASNAEANDQFGSAVDVDADTLVVTATFEDGDATSTVGSPNNNAADAGAAYVFTRSGSSWSQQAYLKAGNAESTDEFGQSVALYEDTIAASTRLEDGDAASTAGSPNNNAANAGAAYVFTRSGSSWSQQAYLKASNAEANDQFGYAIGLDGNSLVVGAFAEDGDASSTAGSPNNNAANAGAVYAFTRSGSNWTQQLYIKASNAETLDKFGDRVAISGDVVAVGSFHEDGDASSTAGSPNNNASNAGAVYIFE